VQAGIAKHDHVGAAPAPDRTAGANRACVLVAHADLRDLIQNGLDAVPDIAAAVALVVLGAVGPPPAGKVAVRQQRAAAMLGDAELRDRAGYLDRSGRAAAARAPIGRDPAEDRFAVAGLSLADRAVRGQARCGPELGAGGEDSAAATFAVVVADVPDRSVPVQRAAPGFVRREGADVTHARDRERRRADDRVERLVRALQLRTQPSAQPHLAVAVEAPAPDAPVARQRAAVAQRGDAR